MLKLSYQISWDVRLCCMSNDLWTILVIFRVFEFMQFSTSCRVLKTSVLCVLLFANTRIGINEDWKLLKTYTKKLVNIAESNRVFLASVRHLSVYLYTRLTPSHIGAADTRHQHTLIQPLAYPHIFAFRLLGERGPILILPLCAGSVLIADWSFIVRVWMQCYFFLDLILFIALELIVDDWVMKGRKSSWISREIESIVSIC